MRPTSPRRTHGSGRAARPRRAYGVALVVFVLAVGGFATGAVAHYSIHTYKAWAGSTERRAMRHALDGAVSYIVSRGEGWLAPDVVTEVVRVGDLRVTVEVASAPRAPRVIDSERAVTRLFTVTVSRVEDDPEPGTVPTTRQLVVKGTRPLQRRYLGVFESGHALRLLMVGERPV